MALEIERKFLVHPSELGTLEDGQHIVQGFIPTVGHTAVRARLYGGRAWLTLKGRTEGATRLEFEYEIPVDDAAAILEAFCVATQVEKTRYCRDYAGFTWEIDVFEGDNDGLIMAEIELRSEDQSFEIPPWVTKEVTGDPRYYNSNISRRPYKTWNDA